MLSACLHTGRYNNAILKPMHYNIFEPSREKTNIVVSTLSIDPDQLKQAYPDRHFSPPVDFLFQESFLYTSISQRRNVSARISLRGLRTLIWVDTLRRCHNVGFLGGTAHLISIP